MAKETSEELLKILADKADLTLEHMRLFRLDLAAIGRKVDALSTDMLNVRKDIHKLGGELLRQEESIAHLALQVDRINTRLGLNETPQ